ncbi:GTPase HflX, partial [candidate division KSB1 bacterium]|nr:GTPase HflX [candidate division KSB1 bacterium]
MHIIQEKKRENAILVGVVHKNQSHEQVNEYLEELELLADTAGADVLSKEIQDRKEIDPAFFIGKGKADMLGNVANEIDASVIIFDDELSPAQTRNLEKRCDVKIIDRNALILDIFASRAKSREARTQVELAQLQYLLPRLTRMWTHLSRQAGGAGIGLRGPGEKQLEVDRRLIQKRITHLQNDLTKIEKQRDIRRRQREEAFKVALMGYTNVGKSTLMNAMTQSDVFVENRLFATLDSTVRRMDISNGTEILLIDTVGFIRKLPHHLVASFKSTLEETQEADLLLHVIDISSPNFREQ